MNLLTSAKALATRISEKIGSLFSTPAIGQVATPRPVEVLPPKRRSPNRKALAREALGLPHGVPGAKLHRKSCEGRVGLTK